VRAFSSKMLAEYKRPEQSLLKIVLDKPEILEALDEEFFQLTFANLDFVDLHKAIFEYWRQSKSLNRESLQSFLSQTGVTKKVNSFSPWLFSTVGIGQNDDTEALAIQKWRAEAEKYRQLMSKSEEAALRRQNLVDSINNNNSDGMHTNMRASKEAKQ